MGRHRFVHLNNSDINRILRDEVILRRKGNTKCHYCRCETNRVQGSPRRITTEHIVPLGLGGTNTVDNMTIACYGCNQRRGSRFIYFHKCSKCEAKLLAHFGDDDNHKRYLEDIMWLKSGETALVKDR